jgi:hypothetical protein
MVKCLGFWERNVKNKRPSKRFLIPEKNVSVWFWNLRNMVNLCPSQRSWKLRIYDHQTANVLYIQCCLLSSYVAFRRYYIFHPRYYIFHPRNYIVHCRYYIFHCRYRTDIVFCCFLFLVSKWNRATWPWNSGLLQSYTICTVKKVSVFPSPAGMALTKLFLAGKIFRKRNIVDV